MSGRRISRPHTSKETRERQTVNTRQKKRQDEKPKHVNSRKRQVLGTPTAIERVGFLGLLSEEVRFYLPFLRRQMDMGGSEAARKDMRHDESEEEKNARGEGRDNRILG